MTWQEWVQLVGTTVSAAAALGALFYAWRTVQEAHELRRDDRLERLAELVVAYGEVIQTHLLTGPDEHPVVRARFRAAIAGAGVRLPASEKLLGFDRSSEPAVVTHATTAALDELARLLTEQPRHRWARLTRRRRRQK